MIYTIIDFKIESLRFRKTNINSLKLSKHTSVTENVTNNRCQWFLFNFSNLPLTQTLTASYSTKNKSEQKHGKCPSQTKDKCGGRGVDWLLTEIKVPVIPRASYILITTPHSCMDLIKAGPLPHGI